MRKIKKWKGRRVGTGKDNVIKCSIDIRSCLIQYDQIMVHGAPAGHLASISEAHFSKLCYPRSLNRIENELELYKTMIFCGTQQLQKHFTTHVCAAGSHNWLHVAVLYMQPPFTHCSINAFAVTPSGDLHRNVCKFLHTSAFMYEAAFGQAKPLVYLAHNCLYWLSGALCSVRERSFHTLVYIIRPTNSVAIWYYYFAPSGALAIQTRYW